MPYKDPAVDKAMQAAYRESHREELRVKQLVYAADHREAKKAYDAAYAPAHREERRARWLTYREHSAAYNAAHAAERRAYSAAYYAAHAAKRRAYSAAYYATHRGEAAAANAAWRAAHPEQLQINSRGRRARKRGAFVENVSPQAVYARDKWKCGICGKKVKPEEASLDHIIPLAKGGEHSYRNVQLAHLKCNISKKDRAIGQQARLL